jgi:hypothetical protein
MARQQHTSGSTWNITQWTLWRRVLSYFRNLILFTEATDSLLCFQVSVIVESSWNVIAHGDAWEGKWRANWRVEWVASTLHTTSEHGVFSITTADAHTSAASSWLNWRPCRFKWTCPFRRKMKSGCCTCPITFQTQSTSTSRLFLSGTARPRPLFL